MKKMLLSAVLSFVIGVTSSIAIHPYNLQAAAPGGGVLYSGVYYQIGNTRYCHCPTQGKISCYCYITPTPAPTPEEPDSLPKV